MEEDNQLGDNMARLPYQCVRPVEATVLHLDDDRPHGLVSVAGSPREPEHCNYCRSNASPSPPSA